MARKDLIPGDLLLFANTYKRGISHIGIYIGNNNFVHAASTRQGRAHRFALDQVLRQQISQRPAACPKSKLDTRKSPPLQNRNGEAGFLCRGAFPCGTRLAVGPKSWVLTHDPAICDDSNLLRMLTAYAVMG